MSYKHFDNWDFKQSVAFIDDSPFEAKIKLEEYIRKYPQDYFCYPYYAGVLITLGEFDKATQCLDYLINLYEQNQHFCNNYEKVAVLNASILFERVRILSYCEKYDDVCELCLNNPDLVNSKGLNHVDFYNKIKSGKLIFENRNVNTYLFRQIVSYNEKDFLDHVKGHLNTFESSVDYSDRAVFLDSFPFNEVIKEIKTLVPSEKRLYPGFYEDSYVFKYTGCGRSKNKSVDYFKVVCFHNTNNIITIYPCKCKPNVPFIDLDYIYIDKIISNKVKKISRIDKFNQKYNRNK